MGERGNPFTMYVWMLCCFSRVQFFVTPWTVQAPLPMEFSRQEWSEKAVAPHSSTLAWKIPWTEESGGLQSTGSRRVRHDWATSLSLFTFMHWRRKWQPTQCSCLENPRDGGAWWAAVCGVAQSQTRLKRLSSSSSNTGLGCHFLLQGIFATPGLNLISCSCYCRWILYHWATGEAPSQCVCGPNHHNMRGPKILFIIP